LDSLTDFNAPPSGKLITSACSAYRDRFLERLRRVDGSPPDLTHLCKLLNNLPKIRFQARVFLEQVSTTALFSNCRQPAITAKFRLILPLKRCPSRIPRRFFSSLRSCLPKVSISSIKFAMSTDSHLLLSEQFGLFLRPGIEIGIVECSRVNLLK